MFRAIGVILMMYWMLVSCTQRTICPAYQSAFIHDKDELRKKFSYFLEDSTPKILTASKTQYLIAEPMPYRKRLRNLQTVDVRDVYVKVPDSLQKGGVPSDSAIMAQFEAAARTIIDSTFVPDTPPAKAPEKRASDDMYVITLDREVKVLKYDAPDSLIYDPVTNRYRPEVPRYFVTEVGYNTEQDNYMWYLRRHLVLPDVRIAQMQEKKGAKGEKQGFFKRLFRKKEKQKEEEPVKPKSPLDEFDFIDEEDSVSAYTPTLTDKGASKQEKKNLRNKKGNKNVIQAEQPAKKEDDDGF